MEWQMEVLWITEAVFLGMGTYFDIKEKELPMSLYIWSSRKCISGIMESLQYQGAFVRSMCRWIFSACGMAFQRSNWIWGWSGAYGHGSL